VIRLAPPLVIAQNDLDTALESIRAAFDELAQQCTERPAA
jgi:acetylornithine/succinyldiaminopimelate/putrescine aminotransferase